MAIDLLIRNVRLSDGGRVDIAIDAGVFTAIDPAGAGGIPAARVIDGAAYVAIPPFVDAHHHLDKTLWGQPWVSNGGGPTRRDYIAHEQQVLADHAAPIAERAGRLIDHMQAMGTLHFRSHVDISPEFGLRHVEALLQLRAARGEGLSLQLVAFPQTGLLSRPGTLDLMRDGLRMGLDVVGGIDPAGFDNDPMAHLRAIFDLAEEFGRTIDIHLHDGGDLGAWEIDRIADLTAARGLAGRVMISHAYCLGAVSESRAGQIGERLARLDISLMTAAPSWTTAPPIALLRSCGLNVCCGSDGIRDTWSPFGTGDMLERAMLLAQRFGWATDRELQMTMDCVTIGGAKALGIKQYGIAPGNPANLLLIEADRAEEIPTLANPARIVISCWRIIHHS